ncbi:MAG TPA: molybdenum cofactor guanylyltransferase [Ilumatobacteraceae bacterium]|nr:molybdenum cofactor guanylyltransferase [Ilumatobacteraceae bacterium]
MPAGAILCGGASRRMGRDKALVEVDGVAMVVRVANALRAAGCWPVFAVGGDQAALAALGVRVIADLYPGEGPVGGVITALGACDTADVVVVACDLPYLTIDTVHALVAASGVAPVTVAVTDRVQPLCALWSREVLAALRVSFDGGERRLMALVDQFETVQVAANPQDLANLNAPGDLPQ